MKVKHIIQNLALIFLLVIVSDAHSQGVQGRVLDSDGNPLPFTTIFIPETGSGTISNSNGSYETKLPPGEYRLSFQYLGYANVVKKVTVGEGWTALDVILQKQAYLLDAAEIDGGKEDPSYKIMRKAIAKSAFHRRQVDRYTCRVYLKGGGRLLDYPWFMKKVIEEEGIDTSATFVQESVTEITYVRPGKYTENVISIRTSGDDRDSSPMNYINGSFYSEEVAGIKSPLSKKAFSYYKFRYINTFRDGDYNINKIEVIPRVTDEEFVTGTIYIVEDLWSIHSVDFEIVPQGITIEIDQIFAPIKPDVWLPISHQYNGKGKLFGFEFSFQYLATVSNYDVEINPDLALDFTVLDSKTEKEEIEKIENKEMEPSETEKKLMSGEEVSTKELRKLMRDYAKEERKKQDEPDIVFERTMKIDSMAYKQDSLYWKEIRPIPLTKSEVKGYALQDSLAEESIKAEEGDTLGGQKGFKVSDLLLGAYYDIGEDQTLRIHGPLGSIRFNTVDGWNGEYQITYYRRFENKNRFEISPLFRYAESRDKGFWKIHSAYTYGRGINRGRISIEGGSYYAQLNRNEPISSLTNTVSSLFAQNNFMKVYDRRYSEINWRQNVSTQWIFEGRADYSQRRETMNTTNFAWFNAEDRSYRPNNPENIELENTSFGISDAFKVRLSTTWMPKAYSYKSRDNYYRVKRYPHLTFNYEKAIPGIGDATIDYDLVSLEIRHAFELGVLGKLDWRAEGGAFLNNSQQDFVDYGHFMGNQTIFTRFGQMEGYSIMSYYEYSTNEEYLSTYLNFEMRRFLFSRIPKLRLAGLTENINVNHLITPSVQNYTEVGYSLTNIFRLFRIDVTGAFLDGKYEDFRVQIGITSNLISVD